MWPTLRKSEGTNIDNKSELMQKCSNGSSLNVEIILHLQDVLAFKTTLSLMLYLTLTCHKARPILVKVHLSFSLVQQTTTLVLKPSLEGCSHLLEMFFMGIAETLTG